MCQLWAAIQSSNPFDVESIAAEAQCSGRLRDAGMLAAPALEKALKLFRII